MGFGMDQAYAIEYRNLYQNHWWWRSREDEILQQLEGVLDPNRENAILDVGCGDGLFFEPLQRFGSVTGVESDSNTMTPDGPWRDQIHCQLFDEQFQPNRKYDAILMLDILEHMPDAESALRHARSLLADDGVLIATVPAFNSLWTSHDDLNHHVVRYTKKSFGPLIAAGGFTPIRSRYLFHWTCPVKLAIRFKEWILGSKPKSPEVPSPFVNQVCLALSKLEQATISRLGMPFGSSLMVIANRSDLRRAGSGPDQR